MAAEPKRAVVFDVMGTLFDLAPLRDALEALGAGPAALHAWFQRILHEAATVTLTGQYRPFKELAASALRTTLAQLDLDPGRTEPLDALSQLDPYPDAEPALRRLRDSGLRVVTLTNGAEESTEELLERGGLREYVEQVLSCDEVEAYKPHPAPYRLALRAVGGDATLVAAHAWDVVGARAAGYRAVWVDREERDWPLPVGAPKLRAGDLVEAARLAVD